MNRKNIIGLILVAAISAASLYGCSNDQNDTPTLVEFSDWQSYQIVRPDMADTDTVKAATTLVKAIEESTGIKPELTTDWVGRGEAVPTGTKEFLIGGTNRPESEGNFRHDDFSIGFVGDRLVINGGSGEAIQAAVDWFAENCLSGGKVYLPDGGYSFVGDYPLENLKLGGVPLSDFKVIAAGSEFSKVAKELSADIFAKTGLSPTSGGHRIIVGNDESVSLFDAVVKLDGNDLKLSVNPSGIDISEAISLFYECLEKRSSDDISPDERKTIEMDNVKILTEEKLKEWRDLTDKRIESIINSKNMEIPEGATVYYVSPNGVDFNDGKTPETAWKTLDVVNNQTFEKGTYICFERGGLWRGKLKAQAGVTYTAYGEGEKPTFYRSPFNAADPTLWEKTDAENVWKIKLDRYDVGTVVFNEGEAHAIKCIIKTEANGDTSNYTTGEPYKDYHDLRYDLHFFHDYTGSFDLYLYSEENPGERFDSIEFNSSSNCIDVKGDGVTIDNLRIKYAGSHGVGAGTVKDLTVQNCEFGWIGGSIQLGAKATTHPPRYGNAVEIYGGCENFTVTDNYIYQVYDAGITQQYKLSDADRENNVDKSQKNMYYARNVIEYCNYSIEYFLTIGEICENPSRMENFLIEDNYMWYAGRGFCEQRSDKGAGAHIKGWSGAGNIRNRATNYKINNNLFVDTNGMMVETCSQLTNPDGSDSMPTLSGNTFAAKLGADFGVVSPTSDVERRKYGPAIPGYLGERSTNDTFWIEE